MAVSFLGVLQRRVAAAQVSHGLAPMVTRLCFKRLKSAAFRVIIGREWRRAAEVPAPVVYSRRQIMSSEMLYFGKLRTKGREMAKTEPSVDQWLREAKADPAAAQCGMFLTHNGVVRITPKAQVREGVEGLGEVAAVEFSYDAEGLAAAEAEVFPSLFRAKTPFYSIGCLSVRHIHPQEK